MPALRNAFSKLGMGQKSEKKEKAVDQPEQTRKISDTFSIFLCDLLNHLEIHRETSYKFDPKLFDGLGVTFESFDPNDVQDQGAFFLPMELEALEEHKPDLSQPGINYLVNKRLGDWYIPNNPIYPEVNYHNAGQLCQALDITFSSIPYKSGEDDWNFLSDWTTWKEIDGCEAFVDPRGFDANRCWNNEWRSRPQEVWAATDKPHMMASMRHDYEYDDNSLFVGEIEVIVALMIVRLISGSFLPDHNVVPVMLFSFTGDKRGRILQAHMNESSLFIRASQFYDFSPRVDAHLSLFVRYMMSRLQGTTKICDRPEIRSSITEEPYTIESLEASGDIQ